MSIYFTLIVESTENATLLLLNRAHPVVNGLVYRLREDVKIDKKKRINGIWKESVKKDFWPYKRKRWFMGNQKQTMN